MKRLRRSERENASKIFDHQTSLKFSTLSRILKMWRCLAFISGPLNSSLGYKVIELSTHPPGVPIESIQTSLSWSPPELWQEPLCGITYCRSNCSEVEFNLKASEHICVIVTPCLQRLLSLTHLCVQVPGREVKAHQVL